MTNVIRFEFKGSPISFNRNGWINATEAAKKFDKRATDWLRLPSTTNYMEVLAEALPEKGKVGKSHFGLVDARRGGLEAGTWLHPKLTVFFARWLSDEFAVQCDLYIDTILFGDLTVYENYKTACDALEAAQKEASKCGKGLAQFRWQKPQLVHSVGYWHEQLELPLKIV